MRRHLLSFLVLFIALTIGLFISPSDETTGIRGLIFGMRAFLNDAVDSHSGLRNEHLGLWKDYDGHVLRVNEYSVVDADCPFVYYKFAVIERFSYPDNEKGYLVQVLYPTSSDVKYAYLGFNKNGTMNLFTYRSMEDYDYGRAISSKGFFKE